MSTSAWTRGYGKDACSQRREHGTLSIFTTQASLLVEPHQISDHVGHGLLIDLLLHPLGHDR